MHSAFLEPCVKRFQQTRTFFKHIQVHWCVNKHFCLWVRQQQGKELQPVYQEQRTKGKAVLEISLAAGVQTKPQLNETDVHRNYIAEFGT